MKLDHVAIWTDKLEEMKDFYVTYFGGKSHDKYVNPKKGFESYFVRFDEGTSIEIMRRVDIKDRMDSEYLGICHLAFTLKSRKEVCEMTERFREDGITIAGEPRVTGDGYFESVILDVDSNRIELVSENPD